MFRLMKSHPFAVRAFFEHSLVLAYAMPKPVLRKHVPDCFEIDTYGDDLGFCAVAMVKTRDMRPSRFPRWMGRDFSLIGYRVFVRYKTSTGESLRGLYILRSETDKRLMQISGNLFTRYNYKTTDVSWQFENQGITVQSEKSKLHVNVSLGDERTELPESSPFPSWKDARKFAGPMPYTFSLNEDSREVILIKGVRSNWNPRPVAVHKHDVGFLEERGFTDAKLANAFVVSNIPYLWEIGQIDPLQSGTVS